MFTSDEKKYLQILVERDLEEVKKAEPAVLDSPVLKLIKGEHEYVHFIEKILEKLK